MIGDFNWQELELRIETQKQTMQSRDESIKKLLEMLQNKGSGKLLPFPNLFSLIFSTRLFWQPLLLHW